MPIRIQFSDYQRLVHHQPTVIVSQNLEGMEPGQEIDVNFKGSIIGVRVVDLWQHSQVSMWCLRLIPTFRFDRQFSDC